VEGPAEREVQQAAALVDADEVTEVVSSRARGGPAGVHAQPGGRRADCGLASRGPASLTSSRLPPVGDDAAAGVVLDDAASTP
jgi:hypothetical protein